MPANNLMSSLTGGKRPQKKESYVYICVRGENANIEEELEEMSGNKSSTKPTDTKCKDRRVIYKKVKQFVLKSEEPCPSL